MVQYREQSLEAKFQREERKKMKLKKSALIERLTEEMDVFTEEKLA